MTNSKLRITFVLPLLLFTGGVRVVLEHTRGLQARGHRVRIVIPRPRPGIPWTLPGRFALKVWLEDGLLQKSRATLDSYGLADCLQRVPRLEGDHLPDGEVLIATAWQTAPAVAAAPDRCGRRAYFLQHYEVFRPEDKEAVDATWRLPLEHIVISSWLASLGREQFGAASWGPVPNAVDPGVFHDRGRKQNESPILGMMYDLQPWKGVDDGFAAIGQVRQTVTDLRLRLFGHYRMRHELQPGDRYFRNPPQETLGDIYRFCDLFLSPSWSEGWGLPVMEAMACGCAVVATESGGINDFTVPGETVLTAPPRHPEELAAQLQRLVLDPDQRGRIARAGTEHVSTFTWEAATDRLEGCLVRIAAGERAE